MATPASAPESAPLSPAAHLPDLYTIESPELRAVVSARTPIRFTDAGEPYLPLPAPHENFYLSPMRQSDLPGDMAMMNDIRVVRSVHGPPFPNPLINAQRHLVRQRALVAALFASYASGTFRPAASSPFDVLRERQPSGPDAYVGQVTIGPDPGAARVSPINDQWEAWRAHGVLDMGAALNVAYHRRGVASAAVRVLLEDWAVPQMGATEIHASAYVSNVTSVRLWEKHGFVEEKGMRGVVSVPEAKGGGEEEDCLLVWRLKD